MEIWIPIVIGIVCLAAGFAGGYVYRRNIAEAKIANAEEAVKKMIGDAQKRAETIKKETVLEAKEEAYRIKNENEKELRERRNELQRNERRLLQREETLDKKIDGIEQREQQLNQKIKEAENTEASIKELYDKQLKELGDKLSADDKARIEAEIANVKKAMEGNDSAAIKAASDKLTEVSYDVFGKIYQQAQQQNPGAGAGFNGSDAGSANTGSAPHDDNVVDADYEVVDDQK